MSQITLAWSAYADAEVDGFRVYRSIPGIALEFPNGLQAGDVFTFACTSPDVQSVTLTGNDIDTVIEDFNAQARGLRAYKSDSEDKIFLRILSIKGRLKIYRSAGWDALSISPQIIVPGLLWEQIDDIAFVAEEFNYEYDDIDGTYLDWYYVSAYDGSTEYLPSITKTPTPNYDKLCFVEGRFIDPQTRPVSGVVVKFRLVDAPSFGQTVAEIAVKSDPYGRISVPLLQCEHYYVEIPALDYSQAVQIPEQKFVNLLALGQTVDHHFSPNGDPQ